MILNECICDLFRILFDCSTLQAKRLILINFLNTLNISFDLHSILNTNFVSAIKIVIFNLEAGLIIFKKKTHDV